MADRIRFDEVLKVDGFGLIVTFDNGTSATYTVDELANLRPHRIATEKVKEAGEE